MERRLTAIMAADVVGYSRLMERDEARTLTELKAHRRELIDLEIDRHHGRMVKLMGDGALVEFASVVEAVTCAVAIQNGMIERNSGAPDDTRIEFRIGVHLGDVIIEGDDIYGEGVNLAARLQELALPGSVLFSQQVYDQVENKLGVGVHDLGQRRVKNISRPVHVWGWSHNGMEALSKITTGGGNWLQADRRRPSIAVLPFVNISGDPNEEYFSDGITEDIIAMLARCRWLLVVARNSSFIYKGKPADVRKVAVELGVKYVIEGSVRRAGTRVRVTAQLLDGRDGTRLWGERYDRELDDIFTLQDEIATAVAGELEPELGMIEVVALHGRASTDLDAWDSYQRGLWHLYRFTMEDLGTAKTLFERAIAIDASFAQAYARLAYVHIQLGWYGPHDERAVRVADAIRFAEQAIEQDGQEPAAHMAFGRALMLSGKPERGVAHLRKALDLDPSFAQGHFALAQALGMRQECDEALREINEAFRLSPRDPHVWTFFNARAFAHLLAGDLDLAEADQRAALRQPNVTFWPAMVLVAILGRQRKMAEAQEAISLLYRFRPDFTCRDARREFYFGDLPYTRPDFIDRFLDDLREAGLPE